MAAHFESGVDTETSYGVWLTLGIDFGQTKIKEVRSGIISFIFHIAKELEKHPFLPGISFCQESVNHTASQ